MLYDSWSINNAVKRQSWINVYFTSFGVASGGVGVAGVSVKLSLTQLSWEFNSFNFFLVFVSLTAVSY